MAFKEKILYNWDVYTSMTEENNSSRTDLSYKFSAYLVTHSKFTGYGEDCARGKVEMPPSQHSHLVGATNSSTNRDQAAKRKK